jgi:hypothetical protein
VTWKDPDGLGFVNLKVWRPRQPVPIDLFVLHCDGGQRRGRLGAPAGNHDLAAIENFSRVAEHHGEGDHDPAQAGFPRARISTLRSLDVQVDNLLPDGRLPILFHTPASDTNAATAQS